MRGSYGKSVTVEAAGAQALVRFDRGANRNALDQDTILALTAAARDLADALEIHAVVLTGAADTFSAGIDLKDPAKWNEEDLPLVERRDIARRGATLCRAWEELPQITIAALEGYAVGGAVALALACDWRVAARNATIYLPEAKVGLNMGWGAIPRMIGLIGPARTKRAILLTERLGAEIAEAWGLVDFLSEPGAAAAMAREVANRAAENPAAVLRMTKEAVNASATALHRATIYMDADQAMVCRDSREGRQAREGFAKPARL